MTEYRLEAMDTAKRWNVVGSLDTSAEAQSYMRSHQLMHPKTAVRVVEHPSRQLIVLHDPNIT